MKTFRKMMRPAVLLGAALSALILFSAGPAHADYMGIKPVSALVTFSQTQPNAAECVVGIKNITYPGANNKTPITQAKVTFEQANTCHGVSFTLTVVDQNGKVSTGTVADLPVPPTNKQKDRVVELDLPGGLAMKNAKPIDHPIVY